MQPIFQAEMMYTYDLGDNWEHEIVLEKVIDDYDANHPICLGGESGYEEFLKIMADPTHTEYEHMIRWSTSQQIRIGAGT